MKMSRFDYIGRFSKIKCRVITSYKGGRFCETETGVQFKINEPQFKYWWKKIRISEK